MEIQGDGRVEGQAAGEEFIIVPRVRQGYPFLSSRIAYEVIVALWALVAAEEETIAAVKDYNISVVGQQGLTRGGMHPEILAKCRASVGKRLSSQVW